MGKLKNGKAAVKDEITGKMTKSGVNVMWSLRVVLCLKIGELLRLFHCTGIKERRLNVRIIDVLA